MRKLPTLIVIASLGSLLGSGPCLAASDCFGTLRDSLAKGGYSGSLDCTSIRTKLTDVGTLTASSNTYAIYDFRFETIPIDGGVSHGGQRIFVFSNDRTYLGQYPLSPPPFHTISVTNHAVHLDALSDSKETLEFEGGVPPQRVLLDGESIQFER